MVQMASVVPAGPPAGGAAACFGAKAGSPWGPPEVTPPGAAIAGFRGELLRAVARPRGRESLPEDGPAAAKRPFSPAESPPDSQDGPDREEGVAFPLLHPGLALSWLPAATAPPPGGEGATPGPARADGDDAARGLDEVRSLIAKAGGEAPGAAASANGGQGPDATAAGAAAGFRAGEQVLTRGSDGQPPGPRGQFPAGETTPDSQTTMVAGLQDGGVRPDGAARAKTGPDVPAVADGRITVVSRESRAARTVPGQLAPQRGAPGAGPEARSSRSADGARARAEPAARLVTDAGGRPELAETRAAGRSRGNAAGPFAPDVQRSDPLADRADCPQAGAPAPVQAVAMTDTPPATQAAVVAQGTPVPPQATTPQATGPAYSPGQLPEAVQGPVSSAARAQGPDDVPSQIAARARLLHRIGGGGTLEVQLRPASLGRVFMRLVSFPGGKLDVVLQAERPQVAEAIRQRAGRLVEILETQGLRVGSLSIARSVGPGNGDGPPAGRTGIPAYGADGLQAGGQGAWPGGRHKPAGEVPDGPPRAYGRSREGPAPAAAAAMLDAAGSAGWMTGRWINLFA